MNGTTEEKDSKRLELPKKSYPVGMPTKTMLFTELPRETVRKAS